MKGNGAMAMKEAGLPATTKLSQPQPTNFCATPMKSAAASPNSTLDDQTKVGQVPITPEQISRMGASRKHALELQAASREERHKKTLDAQSTCTRCGSTTPGSLCLVWNHTGGVEHTMYTGPDKPHYIVMKCCGRFDRQPCFIGKHIYAAGSKARSSLFDPSFVLQCHCHKLAILRRTRKEGRNTGRYFFCCGSYGRAECKYFKWADQVYDLDVNQAKPQVSPDGVKEWLEPHANPFSEPNLFQQGRQVIKAQSRKRLIAALLIREMIFKVRDGPFVVSTMPSELLVFNVMQRLTKGENGQLLSGLSPLTRPQIDSRLGPLSSIQEPFPTKAEVQDVLLQALFENQVIRSTVNVQCSQSQGTQGC